MELQIIQEISVAILRPDQIEQLSDEPSLKVSEVDVYILLPPLTSLKAIAERMRALTGYITISANMRGSLLLRAITPAVEVDVEFQKLVNPELNEEQEEKPASALRDPFQMCSARVDAKEFLKFLYSYHLQPQNVVCCIVEETQVLMIVYITPMRGTGTICGTLTICMSATLP